MSAEATVITARDADPLERRAAEDLTEYLAALFGVGCAPSTDPSSTSTHTFFVGAGGDRGLFARFGGESLSDQGYIVRSGQEAGSSLTLVAGGSPAATYWAVHELAETWGVRHLIHRDVLPEPRTFEPGPVDLTREPRLGIRQWRTVNDFACGPESWGLDDCRPVLTQLARMRYNRVFLSLWPWQPFLDLRCGGIDRRSADLWFGFHYPITDDMPGRRLFGDDTEFWNPDLPCGAPYRGFAAAGESLIHGIIAEAHALGMECAVAVSPLEYPPEFAPLLPDAQEVRQLGVRTVVPGPRTEPDHPALIELAGCVLRTAAETYPEADLFVLGMPEFRQWIEHHEAAWEGLDKRHGISRFAALSDLLAAAARRSATVDYMAAEPDRAVNEVKGDLVALEVCDRLLSDTPVRQRIVFANVAEELLPVAGASLPDGGELLSFIEYTPRRVLARSQALQAAPATEVPCSLVLTLHDDNVGLLPQLETTALHRLIEELVDAGWSGFSTRYWLTGDHDTAVAHLARAAWQTGTSPRETDADLIHAICGEGAVKHVAPALLAVEKATRVLEERGLGFAFPVDGMMLRHWSPEPLPQLVPAVRRLYQEAQDSVVGAYYSAEEGSAARRYTAYWMNRLEFGICYMDAVRAVRRAAQAQADGDLLECVRQTKQAATTLARGIDAYARARSDRSDAGAVAVLAEYAWRPLNRRIEELEGGST